LAREGGCGVKTAIDASTCTERNMYVNTSHIFLFESKSTKMF